MNRALSRLLLILLWISSYPKGALHAQVCANQYRSLIYKGITFDSVIRSITTPANEIVTTGYIRGYEGWIAKYSPKGSPIWSNEYLIPYRFNRVFYQNLRFNDMIATSDSCFLAGGSVLRSYYINTDLFGNTMAVITKVDKYGAVRWSKRFLSILGQDLAITNIIETAAHDYIIYLATDNGIRNFSYGKVIRMNSNGDVLWTRLLFTNSFDAGGRGLTFRRALGQLANKNIVIGDVVYELDRTRRNFTIKESDLHFLCLDYATGALKWETSYEYPRFDPDFIPNFAHVEELPDGSLQFITSLQLPTPTQLSPSMKGISIHTDNTGHIDQMLAYYPATGHSAVIKDVVTDKNNGNKTFLLNNFDTAIVANINRDGSVNWCRQYDNDGARFPGTSLSSGANGFAISMSNYKNRYTRMLLTHAKGEIDCVDEDQQLVVEPVTMQYHQFGVFTDNTNPYRDPYEAAPSEMTTTPYALEQEIACEEQADCCKDVVDTLNITRISICEGGNYLLPDNTKITMPGRYYVTFKTSRGCDSIRYYDAEVNKDPASLSLGNDTCLLNENSILLNATPGFTSYNWMGQPADSSHYRVYAKGIYWVSVSNACGNKRDSIEVFDQCDFPIFMPTAFTPNHDTVNDTFGIAPQNRNRLVSLRVFNRWGQLVFMTTDAAKSWNGTIKGIPADPGLFVYQLEMQGLSGKKISAKGQVLLIR